MKLRNLFYLLALVSVEGLTQTSPEDSIRYQDLNEVERKVSEFVKNSLVNRQLPGRLEIEVTNIDPRLRLPNCDTDLELGDSRFQFRHRTSVKVACNGSKPWSIYAAIQIAHWLPVVVAARPLSRGHFLSEDSLTMMEQDISDIQSGFFTAKSELFDRPLKRSVAQGTILGPNLVDLPVLVFKGDDVVIQAISSSFTVKVSGTALNDGRMGRQIAVRNNQSNRIIKAKVISSGVVSVKL